MKKLIIKSYITVKDIQSSILNTDRISRHKFNKNVKEWNNTINQLGALKIYRSLYSIIEKYSFFSSSHGTLPKDYIQHFKMNFIKFKNFITENMSFHQIQLK